jgi:hypothetical protein
LRIGEGIEILHRASLLLLQFGNTASYRGERSRVDAVSGGPYGHRSVVASVVFVTATLHLAVDTAIARAGIVLLRVDPL